MKAVTQSYGWLDTRYHPSSAHFQNRPVASACGSSNDRSLRIEFGTIRYNGPPRPCCPRWSMRSNAHDIYILRSQKKLLYISQVRFSVPGFWSLSETWLENLRKSHMKMFNLVLQSPFIKIQKLQGALSTFENAYVNIVWKIGFVYFRCFLFENQELL